MGKVPGFEKQSNGLVLHNGVTLTLSYDNDGFIMDSLKMMTIDKTDEKNVFHAFLPFPKPAAYIIHNKIKPLETI